MAGNHHCKHQYSDILYHINALTMPENVSRIESALSLAPLRIMAQPHPLDLPYIFPDRDHTHSPDLWLLGLKSMDGRAEKGYIHKISYFKDRKPSFHEFILVEIMHPCSVQSSLAITERTPKESDHYTSKQALSPSISGRVPAHDTVRLPAGPHISKRSSPNKLAELTFEPDKLPLLKLAILLTVVSQYAPNYDVWDYQCYWYADTIYQSIKTLFEPANEHIEPALSKHRRKYLLGLPLPKGSVGPILEEYNMAMEKYETEKTTKEKARRDKEKVGFLDSKAVFVLMCLLKIEQADRDMERQEWEREKARQREYERNVEAWHQETKRTLQELERKVQECQKKAREWERNAQESKRKELEALRLLKDSKNVTVSDERPPRRTRGQGETGPRCYSLPSPMLDDSLARMFL